MKRMLALLLGGLVCLCGPPSARGQGPDLEPHELTGPVRLLWEYNHPFYMRDVDSLSSVAVSPDGARVFVTTDWFIYAHRASTGVPLWQAYLWVYDPVAASVAASPSGTMAFTTTVQRIATDPERILLITQGFNAPTGEPSWKNIRRFSHLASAGWTGGVSVAVSPDGASVFVAGFAEGTAPWTIALDAATGQDRWTGRASGGDALATSPDGSAVFVSGDCTLALDATTGEEIWYAEADGFSNAASPDGSTVFVTGATGTVALDAATGNELWYDPESGAAVVTSPDGSLAFVTGDAWTVAHDAATGEPTWTARFKPGRGPGQAATLAVSPDGRTLFVTGAARGRAAGEDCATVGYDATTGSEIWTARYDGPASGDDRARAIAVSPDGTAVFVVAESEGLDAWDESITIVYEPLSLQGCPPAPE